MPYPMPAVRGRMALPMGSNLWWLGGGAPNPIATWQPKGAASLAASYINLANPGTYNAAAGTAPSFSSSTGWGLVTASAQYLITGLVPGDDWTLLVRFSDAESGSRYLMRVDKASNWRFGFSPIFTGNYRYYYAGKALVNGIAGGQAAGVMGFAGLRCFLNGTYENTAPAGAGANDLAIHIGCNWNGTARGNYFTGNIQAISIWPSALTDTQVAIISASMAAL